MLTRRPLAVFGSAMLVFYVLLWGAELAFPGTVASAVVLVVATSAAALVTRPGWNIRAGGSVRYLLFVFGLLLASAAAAAGLLKAFKIALPYDPSSPNLLAALPAIAVLAAIEELLFRQVAFRWLEQRQLPQKKIVLATAVAYALAHSGALFTVGTEARLFYVLLSLYLIWIGMLLGELRRASGSWVVSWLGHVSYNLAVLALLSIGRQP